MSTLLSFNSFLNQDKIFHSQIKFRFGSDGADDPYQQRGGHQDEKVPEGPDAEQGQTDKADGRGPQRY